MQLVTVADAAIELGVSERRVRQLLERGELAGEHVGRSWVAYGDDLDRALRRRREPGRPFSEPSAWALLLLASGEQPSSSTALKRRARARLNEHSLVDLAPKLVRRATTRRLRSHPGMLVHLRRDGLVVRTGVSASADVGADIIALDQFEGYVAKRHVEDLIERYALDPNAEQLNVVLRVVSDDVWPFAPDQRVAPRPIVALDLLEADDDRTRRAGRDLAALTLRKKKRPPKGPSGQRSSRWRGCS